MRALIKLPVEFIEKQCNMTEATQHTNDEWHLIGFSFYLEHKC